MIHLPRRSVTRFFIPMIDVLTLLFCIFLLMPIFKENESQGNGGDHGASPGDQAKELARRNKQLQQLQMDERRVRDTLAELEKKNREFLQQNLYIHVLQLDPATGELFFIPTGDPPRPAVKIDSAERAAELVREHTKEAGKRTLYYLFLEPRTSGGAVAPVPSPEQARRYRVWFGDVAFGGFIEPAPGKGGAP